MDTLVYAAKNKNIDVLLHSSSGGMFSALTEDFIKEGNAVLCVHYNYENNDAEFHLVESLLERDRSRGSLYIQSKARDSWKAGIEWLENHKGKSLLFIGVGCQAAAFIRYAEMKGVKDQVIVVDMVCHGSPSPLVWRQYISSVIGKGKLSDVNFRDKKTGWSHSVGTAKIDGKEISIHPFRKLYSSRNILRPCCSRCPYTTIKRKSDLTLGDFWHIEMSLPEFKDEKGVSLVLIHTERGYDLFKNAQKYLDVIESNVNDCWQMNLEKPTEHANGRSDFWDDFQSKDLEYVINKYTKVTILHRIKRNANKIIRHLIPLSTIEV